MGVTRRYTDPQRDSIVRAVLVDGLSRGEARRLAEAGKLADGLAPFRIPYSSTVAMVKRASESFFAEQMRSPTNARRLLDADALRLVELAHTTVEKVTAAAKKDGSPDPVAVKKAADAITAARRALPPERPAAKLADPAETSPTESEPDGTLATLLALAPSTNHANGHTTAEHERAS